MPDYPSRVPVVTSRDELPEDQRHHFDRIERSRGGVRGPFSVLLHSPEVGGRVGHLGAYIRFESQLSGPERELTIITTAREFDCAYEWDAHEPLAREAGVRDEAIEVVARRRGVESLDGTEALIVRYTQTLLREHEVPDELFDAAKGRFGVQGVTELTATIGYYAMLACVLNAFEVTGSSP